MSEPDPSCEVRSLTLAVTPMARIRHAAMRMPDPTASVIQPPAIGAMIWYSSTFGSNGEVSSTCLPSTFFETTHPC